MTDKEMIAVYKIVDQNADRPDLTRELLVYCAGVACEDCPMQKVGTLGEVRAMDDRNVPKAKEPSEPKEDDGVKQPSHYQLFEGVEAIEVIARSMTQEMFKGYCLGNILKYRLRAGKKSELATLEKDMAKATFYLELYAKYKGSCHD
ncbi:MAG: nucleotide kinase [Enterobacter phage ENC14]|nr:MAG: nucleotide kinase [Enterobacter phage ENC14]